MSSKKALRKKKYLAREKKRALKKEAEEKYRKAMSSGSIEEMALAMGLKLR